MSDQNDEQKLSDEEIQRRVIEELRRRQAEERARHQQAQQELLKKVNLARQVAQLRQQWIDEEPRPKYAVIAAVDLQGGFAKNGEIPWHFPTDLKWFANRTRGHVCVMGRTTYEDINKRLGEKAEKSVLPGRKCFVVSTTLEELPNATVVKSLGDVGNYLSDGDVDKTIFIIGGERLFVEGISIAEQVILTIVNSEYNCDKFFPVWYVQQHFETSQVFMKEDAPELRFVIWKRKEG